MRAVDAVIHTATLHKPHVATHARQDFVNTNITGTLHLLEEAMTNGVGAFVFTSTTSAFGRALTPYAGAPAAWITEDVVPVPRNIYGVTKVAAENLCELFHRNLGLPCLILRTSRFFPEPDDRKETRQTYDDANVKATSSFTVGRTLKTSLTRTFSLWRERLQSDLDTTSSVRLPPSPSMTCRSYARMHRRL